MAITDNLKSVMKAFTPNESTSVSALATMLERTPNSVRSTLSVPSYKQYFEKITTYNKETQKNDITYKLSQKGIDLINNDFKLEEENK